MNYILGASISGLVWAYYHPDDVIVSDAYGWAVRGANPLLLLHDSPATRVMMDDLGLGYEVTVKPIGYKTAGGLCWHVSLDDAHLDDLYLKKMTPWSLLRRSRDASVEIEWTLPSRRVAADEFGSGDTYIQAINVDTQVFVDKLVMLVEAREQVIVRRRVTKIWHGAFQTDNMETYSYDRLVSTLPAPVFERLWVGDLPWRGRLHYMPLTVVLSKDEPDWWSDKWAVVYSADLSHPACRVARVDEFIQYEIVGKLEWDDPDLQALKPVSFEHVFAVPYGRIVQDAAPVTPPSGSRVEFLGRFAQWRYDVLTAHVIERAQEAVL